MNSEYFWGALFVAFVLVATGAYYLKDKEAPMAKNSDGSTDSRINTGGGLIAVGAVIAVFTLLGKQLSRRYQR